MLMLSYDQIAHSFGIDTIILTLTFTIMIEIYSLMDIEWYGTYILIFNRLTMMNDNVEICEKFSLKIKEIK